MDPGQEPHTPRGDKKGHPANWMPFLKTKNPGDLLLSRGLRLSTIAVRELNFRVRNGDGCVLPAIITGKSVPPEGGKTLHGESRSTLRCNIRAFFSSEKEKRWSSLTAD